MAKETSIDTETTPAASSSNPKEWLKKMDGYSVGDIRKKYPKAFWIVGGVVLLALVF